VKTMKPSISLVLVVLFLAFSISAQPEDTTPKLVDEFGNLPLGETMARIDALMVVVGNTPNSKALVKIYGGQEESFARPFYHGSVIKGYWSNSRGYSAEKLTIEFCNISKEPIRTKFFLVGEDDEIEACAENLVVPKETVLIESVGFYSREFKLMPQERTVVEYGLSEGEYSGFAQNVLKRFLNDSPQSKVYIIAYLKTNFETDDNGKIIAKKTGRLDKKSFAGKMLQAARKELLKNGFSPAQIVTTDGGYINDNERRLEFWFVPEGGAIPQPKPEYVPKKSN
jgi:hypothetical protein